MSKDKDAFGWIYGKWYLLVLLITGVSVVIGFVFSLFLGKDFSLMGFMFPSLINTACIWGGSMGIVIFVWKKLPWELHPLKHLLVEILLILLFLTVFILLMNLYYSEVNHSGYVESFRSNLVDIIITTLITFLIVTIHEAVFFYRQWKIHFSKSVKLEKENLEARYHVLKAQINPHFLFNSLNSLMVLVEGQSDAEKYVQDLSGFLRYTLTSGNKDIVSLKEELEYVEKYIRLQHQRFGDNFSVSVEVDDASLGRYIPSLALQMLLENCLNHNVITRSSPLYIRIFTRGEELTVTNNLQKKHVLNSTGQGLKNIAGRYRLTGGQEIRIGETPETFSVTIPLLPEKNTI